MASFGQRGRITFELVAMVLLFPLGGKNVEISWLIKKAEIARSNSRRKNSFKLTPARKLVLHLDQNSNIVWRQDIQHRCIELLWPKGQGRRGRDRKCKLEEENQVAGGQGTQLWGPRALRMTLRGPPRQPGRPALDLICSQVY